MNKFAPHLTDAQFAGMPLSERFVQVAAYYADKVHAQEEPKGSNRGTLIDQWNHEAGAELASPWCASFVTHCLKEAGYKGPLPANPASTHSWATWAVAHRLTAMNAMRGDIFVLLFSAATGHMGIHLDDTGRTIEGNSNDDGSREGYEVCRHSRKTTAYPPNRLIIRLADTGGK